MTGIIYLRGFRLLCEVPVGTCPSDKQAASVSGTLIGRDSADDLRTLHGPRIPYCIMYLSVSVAGRRMASVGRWLNEPGQQVSDGSSLEWFAAVSRWSNGRFDDCWPSAADRGEY